MTSTGASLPSTDVLIQSIREGGYVSERQWYREWLQPRGYSRTSVQEALDYREGRFGTQDRQREKAALAENRELAQGYEDTGEQTRKEVAEWDQVANVTATNITKNITSIPLPFVKGDFTATDELEFEEEDEPRFTDRDLADYISIEKQRARTANQQKRVLMRKLSDQRNQAKQAAEAVYKAVNKMSHTPPSITVLPKSEVEAEPWIPLIVTSDIHAGAQVWGREGWGENYTTDIACQRIVDHANDVSAWIRTTPGDTPEGWYVDVGDYFHTLDGQTEAGTDLHMDTRAKRIEQKVTEASLEAMQIIKAALNGGVLRRRGAQGNHDHIYHYMHMKGVYYYFLRDEGVDVQQDYNNRSWFTIGDEANGNYSVHVLDHGKGISRLETPSMNVKMRNTIDKIVPPSVQAGARHVYYYCGHLHHRGHTRYKAGEHEDGKYLFRRMPAIAEPGAYEDSLRVFSTPGAQAFKLDLSGKAVGTHETFFEGQRV